LAVVVVDACPFFPGLESFVLPDYERIRVDDCGLDDFLIHENSPSDCIDVISLNVREHVSFYVDCLV